MGVSFGFQTQEAGHFWAFFPTSSETKIAGILNAPWKLNSDRTASITGAWNNALMDEAAKLIVETLPQLAIAEDPGRLLDAFPRQTDSNELATPLVDALWKEIEASAVIPDADGKLHKAEELYLFPEEIFAAEEPQKEPQELIEAWLPLLSSETKAQIVHPTCFPNRNRKARLEELASRLKKNGNDSPNLQPFPFVGLIGETTSKDIQQSKNLLSLLKQIHGKISPEKWSDFAGKLNATPLLPSADGKLECINNLIIGPEKFGDKTPIAFELAADEECAKILTDILPVRKTDDTRAWEARLSKALETAQPKTDDNLWKQFWRELRAAPETAVTVFVEENKSCIRAKRRDGNWCVPQEVLLPGGWVCEDDKENTELLLDEEEHIEDSALAQKLDIFSTPELQFSEKYELPMKSHYREFIKSPIEHPLFKKLRGIIKKKLTRDYIKLFQEKSCSTEVSYQRTRVRDSITKTLHPFLGIIRDHGDLADLFITSDKNHLSYLNGRDLCGLLLPEAEKRKWLVKGARDLEEEAVPVWNEIEGSESIISVIPEFSKLFDKSEHLCQFVKNLTLRIAETSEPVPCFYWWKNKEFYIDKSALEKLPLETRYRVLFSEMKNAGWVEDEVDGLVKKIYDPDVASRRRAVFEKGTLPERLLAAVGKKQPLLAALGNAPFLKESDDVELARLTLAQFGIATLSQLQGAPEANGRVDKVLKFLGMSSSSQGALEANGLKPPSRWNSDEARQFVAELGFPPEYASAPSEKREAETFISGPIPLGPLHDFQEEVKAGLKEVIQRHEFRRRAVVSLPTGAGAVEFVLKPEGGNRSVIWVAQADELCEQAVQSFKQVWLNHGAERTELRICRLWGRNQNLDIQDTSKPLVVVASIQTLDNRMGQELDKIKSPGLLVVDECHHAITKSYTGLLQWLDAAAPKPWEKPEDLAAKKEPPIIGLSATPFRGNVGTSEDETTRLARRFDNTWLPKKQEQLYENLLKTKVLADIKSDEIESTESITNAETERIESLIKQYGSQEAATIDIENIFRKIDKRFAESSDRNERIVKFIKESPEAHILFFANSVAHAKEIALRLNFAGVSAAPIDGETPKNARRDFLDKFQRGEIRVLCNHSILTTGFDAPKTDMIFISRTIFSPVSYMQIVGRGLRGPRNGGTKTCRIVTVKDNIGRFENKRAYHYCKRFYESVPDTRVADR